MKVLNLEEFKGNKELKKCEHSFGRYLKTLSNTQLEIEVNALLEEFSDDSYRKDFFSKARLILKEITSRAQGPIKNKIETMAKETFKKL
jgi:hypothetical protein